MRKCCIRKEQQERLRVEITETQDRFRNTILTYLSLLKNNTEINVNDLAGFFVDKNVTQVSIANAKYMANNGAYCHRTCVIHLGSVPRLHAVPKVLDKKEAVGG